MKIPFHSFKGRFVGVIGAGRSGLAAARLLVRSGARVLLSENRKLSSKPSLPRGVELEIGRHSNRLLTTALLVRSPGVPDHLSILARARREGIPIWSELELASRLIHPKRLIAITGTNGKTTTTTLIGQLFKAVYPSTFVAGNIGTPLSAIVNRVRMRSTVVIEASSYQLENIQRFHPTVSVILNITPDHLEHHGSMRAYVAAKARIFENQKRTDICVLNADDPWCRRLARRCPGRVLFFSRRKHLRTGVYFNGGNVVIRWGRQNHHFPLQWDLPGPHNVENALASIAVAVAEGLPLHTIQRVIRHFRGVEHRLEHVRKLRAVHYVNDSKATNVDSTRVALQSFKNPLVLIMGGRGKGTPYTSLRSLVKERVRTLLLIGEDAKRIQNDLGSVVPVKIVGNMRNAVIHARKFARPGEVVLLSPACASFDQYLNYEARGHDFKQLVRRLR